MDKDLIENIMAEAPSEEPERQAFFKEECAKLLSGIAKERNRELTFHVNTFGCQMNAKDSEKLARILTDIGYRETDSENADFVLFNTCTVRENANVRFYGRLGSLKGIKKQKPDMIIAVCGCMMQEKQVVQTINEKYPHVNIIFGTHNIYKLAELLFLYLARQQNQTEILDGADRIVENLPSSRKYPFKSGVNIMYGCNNFCSYCIVPYVRGRERSRTPEDILKEVRSLASEGVIEIMLLGQNVNSYQADITFPELLKQVAETEGIKRVRFMTSHPKDLSDELIEVIRQTPSICRHIHLPLQSGSSRILKEMNRRYDKQAYLDLASKIRERIPDVSITTDIIVGFPGETEEDFLETMDVVEKVRFDSAFTFIYSKRSGTKAASMPDQVPREIVDDRFKRLLNRVTEISREQTVRYRGRTMPVLAEEINVKDPSLLSGRLSNNSVVHFKADPKLIGQIVDVTLEEAKGFYYYGTLAHDVSVSGDEETI
ncbi:MAG: tRNA (N6-isopentenyl adenosine(37)-C2)-methylthiotransferase MiaB [Parasporobacterium sp.]|nr:tRNA (N6-isopentenyl adenosine(37)-C2)-methylthiotransferase MiaB [Parasporobacterium sp.]